MNEPIAQPENQNSERMRIWRPTTPPADYSITKDQAEDILNELVRKVDCANNNKVFEPNPQKDAYLTQHRKDFPFEFGRPQHCLKFYNSLRARQLRHQSLYFLKLIKNKQAVIERLIEQCHAETDNDTKICIHQLIKRKKINLVYMENIRENMAELISLGEEGVTFLIRCCKILKTK